MTSFPDPAHRAPDVGEPPTVPGGYEEDFLELDDCRLSFLRPAEPDGILAIPEIVERFDRDGDAPYWTHIWPPNSGLSRLIYRAAWPPNTSVLEIGCGAGVVSMAAARRGWRVTASDNQPEAVQLAVSNAVRNHLNVEGLQLDWRRPVDRHFDRIIGCDVTYDLDFHLPILKLTQQMLAEDGEAWFADFGRLHAPRFYRLALDHGFNVVMVDEDDNAMESFQTAKFQLFKLKKC